MTRQPPEKTSHRESCTRLGVSLVVLGVVIFIVTYTVTRHVNRHSNVMKIVRNATLTPTVKTYQNCIFIDCAFVTARALQFKCCIHRCTRVFVVSEQDVGLSVEDVDEKSTSTVYVTGSHTDDTVANIQPGTVYILNSDITRDIALRI